MEKKCKCCGKILSEKNYYYSNNLIEYPDGYLNICKDCLKGTVKVTYPRTFLWILKQCDVPFFPKEWYHLIQRYGDTCPIILGRYLSKMKLYSFKHMRWKDTFYFLEQEANYSPHIEKQGKEES